MDMMSRNCTLVPNNTAKPDVFLSSRGMCMKEYSRRDSLKHHLQTNHPKEHAVRQGSFLVPSVRSRSTMQLSL